MTPNTALRQKVLTTDSTQRERAFKAYKESSEQMIHRLRTWHELQVVWGYETHTEQGTTGKTYTRRGRTRSHIVDSDVTPDDNVGHNQARDSYFEAVDNASPNTAMFLWVARIESTRTEPRGPDPGEPPLKFASLKSARVVHSVYIPADPPEEESYTEALLSDLDENITISSGDDDPHFTPDSVTVTRDADAYVGDETEVDDE